MYLCWEMLECDAGLVGGPVVCRMEKWCGRKGGVGRWAGAAQVVCGWCVWWCVVWAEEWAGAGGERAENASTCDGVPAPLGSRYEGTSRLASSTVEPPLVLPQRLAKLRAPPQQQENFKAARTEGAACCEARAPSCAQDTRRACTLSTLAASGRRLLSILAHTPSPLPSFFC